MIGNAILYRMRSDSNLDKIDESLKDLDEAYIFLIIPTEESVDI
jgi:hypothetical protein